jgi:hypothetical protein
MPGLGEGKGVPSSFEEGVGGGAEASGRCEVIQQLSFRAAARNPASKRDSSSAFRTGSSLVLGMTFQGGGASGGA